MNWPGIRIRQERRRALPHATATQERRAEYALRQPISRVGEVTTSLFRSVGLPARVQLSRRRCEIDSRQQACERP